MRVKAMTARPAARLPRSLPLWGLLLALLLGAAGCLGLSQRPAVMVEQYTLEYPPPQPGGAASLPVGLLVERFSLAADYSGQAMLYRPADFRRQAYQYHRWRANPADLVTDYLLRDLVSSGLFAGVFSHRQPSPVRFRLQGGVREFLEVDGDGGPQAVVEVSLSLLDNDYPDLPRRLVFQRIYRQAAAMAETSAPALARGMSQAMAELSQRLRDDLRQAVAQRLAQPPDAG